MHYRIVYGRKKRSLPQLTRKQKIVAIAVILSISLVVFCLAGGMKLLLPGDPDVSAAALENMVQSIQDGESLSDAVTAFCQEIMTNAQ